MKLFTAKSSSWMIQLQKTRMHKLHSLFGSIPLSIRPASAVPRVKMRFVSNCSGCMTKNQFVLEKLRLVCVLIHGRRIFRQQLIVLPDLIIFRSVPVVVHQWHFVTSTNSGDARLIIRQNAVANQSLLPSLTV